MTCFLSTCLTGKGLPTKSAARAARDEESSNFTYWHKPTSTPPPQPTLNKSAVENQQSTASYRQHRHLQTPALYSSQHRLHTALYHLYTSHAAIHPNSPLHPSAAPTSSAANSLRHPSSGTL